MHQVYYEGRFVDYIEYHCNRAGIDNEASIATIRDLVRASGADVHSILNAMSWAWAENRAMYRNIEKLQEPKEEVNWMKEGF